MKPLRLRVHDASNISIIIMISDCSMRRKKREPYKNNKKSSLRAEYRINTLSAKMAWSPESNPGYIR